MHRRRARADLHHPVAADLEDLALSRAPAAGSHRAHSRDASGRTSSSAAIRTRSRGKPCIPARRWASRSSAFTTRTFRKRMCARRGNFSAALSPSSSSISPGATSATSTTASSAPSCLRRRSARCSPTGACAMSRAPTLAWTRRSFIPDHSEPGENVRAELGIPRERTLLLYVGRLAQEKNTHTLFAAFARSRARFRSAFICSSSAMDCSAGNSNHRSPDTRSAITHLPYCADPQRLAALYRAADLFVHPGVQETFGLVALEAQACGTPVIGIRGSYMDRIIHSDQTLWARENSARRARRGDRGDARGKISKPTRTGCIAASPRNIPGSKFSRGSSRSTAK